MIAPARMILIARSGDRQQARLTSKPKNTPQCHHISQIREPEAVPVLMSMHSVLQTYKYRSIPDSELVQVLPKLPSLLLA
jgi:hypothetical protein